MRYTCDAHTLNLNAKVNAHRILAKNDERGIRMET